ncbi:MAG: hypothetical protein NUV58_04800, partial [Candidatus Roizmanbacteria bacterium]|nr:hypothetical protein [Candidatus Roizmanbacteria bacterium]
MVRVETIRNRVSEIILPVFNNIDGLQTSCLAGNSILPDSSLRMCMGINATSLNGVHFINGQYGIKKFDAHTDEYTALCGFDIENNEMVIRHTPQGKKPEEFSSGAVRNRLGRSNFRIEMMQAMIEIAKKLGLKGVVGFPVRPYSVGDVRTYLHKTAGRDGMFALFDFELRNAD